ncbi:nicotinamide riboside transporter PnuC [Rummeliibacillus pycnus]|uniref:nicotinamide riboside transporter PnuC n=1 Tax=Rummeliibacillus pycnus TaxID=101070 RepID=UPI003D2B5AEC
MLKNWTLFEKLWLIISTAVIVTLSFIWKDTLIGFISSITGIICVVLVAKGKISNFYFGLVNAIAYGYVAYGYGLYGEAMLNILFYAPIQFIAFFAWIKHKKSVNDAVNGEEVYAKRLSKKQWIILGVIIAVGWIAYAEILFFFNAQQVRLDSLAVVLSVIAQFLLLFRYAEQWVMWIVVDVLTISLWIVTLVSSGGNDWAVLVMWIAFLINAIYGYINWLRISKEGK